MEIGDVSLTPPLVSDLRKSKTPPLTDREKWGPLSASLWCSLLFIQIGHVHQWVLVADSNCL